jgi:hypothetical protein
VSKFIVSGSHATPRIDHGLAVHDNHLYVAGGATVGVTPFTCVSSVEFGRIHGNGSVDHVRASMSLPSAVTLNGLHASGGYLYAFSGGPLSQASYDGSVWSARIAGNGELGTWSLVSSGPKTNLGVVVRHGNHVYAVGGFNATWQKGIFRSSFIVGGQMTPWVAQPDLGLAPAGHAAAVCGDFLYVQDSTGKIYWSRISPNGDLSVWKNQGDPLAARISASLVSNGHSLFLSGGYHTAPGEYSDVCVAHVNADGSPREFKRVTTFPGPRDGVRTIVHGEHLVISGGEDPSGNPVPDFLTAHVGSGKF